MNATDTALPSPRSDNRIVLIAGVLLLAFGGLIIYAWSARMRRMESNDLIMIVAKSVQVARARGETFDPPITDNGALAHLLVEQHHFRPPAKRLVDGRLVDTWGHALDVFIGVDRVRIVSAGPDGNLTTADDNLGGERQIRADQQAPTATP